MHQAHKSGAKTESQGPFKDRGDCLLPQWKTRLIVNDIIGNVSGWLKLQGSSSRNEYIIFSTSLNSLMIGQQTDYTGYDTQVG